MGTRTDRRIDPISPEVVCRELGRATAPHALTQQANRHTFEAMKPTERIAADSKTLALSASVPVSAQEKILLQERWQEHLHDPKSALSLEEFKQRLDQSHEWHREVLEERERRIASGKAGFTDWEQAKADIRKRVS